MRINPNCRILSALPDPPEINRTYLNDPWLVDADSEHPYLIATDGYILAKIPALAVEGARDGGIPAQAFRGMSRGVIGFTDDQAGSSVDGVIARPPASRSYPRLSDQLPSPWPARPADLILDAKYLYRLARALGAHTDGTDRHRPVRLWIDRTAGKLYVRPGSESEVEDPTDAGTSARGVLMLIKPPKEG